MDTLTAGVPVSRQAPTSSPWDRHRYVILAGLLFLLLLAQTLRQQWSSDMWVHVATIREQTAHLLHPHNALLVANDPFPYFSPYTTAVAAVAKVFHLGPISALQLAAMVNLVIFLWAFQRFVTSLLGDRRVAFYGLILTLVLWGISPFRASGFLNLNSIGFMLPYPSMFADAMAFIGLGSLVMFLRNGSRRELFVVTVTAALVVISHPLTASWLTAAAVALVIFSVGEVPVRRFVELGLAAVVVALLAAAWPMYSVFSLAGNGATYTSGNKGLYQNPLLRTFLALPGLWIIFQRSRRRWRDSLGLILLVGLILYLVSWLANNLAYGRALIPVMLSLHLALALEMVRFEDWARSRPRWTDQALVTMTVGGVMLLIGVMGVAPGVAHILPTSLRHTTVLDDVPGQLGFLHEVPANAVVVAEPSQLVGIAEPAFGGKLLTSSYAGLPGTTTKEAVAATGRFFAAGTSARARTKLIARYHVAYVVTSRAMARRLAKGIGSIIGCSAKWAVVATAPGHPKASACY